MNPEREMIVFRIAMMRVGNSAMMIFVHRSRGCCGNNPPKPKLAR